MTKLEKKRDELAGKYCEGLNKHTHYGLGVDCFNSGFNAMLAEHNRIVVPLIEMLEFYPIMGHPVYQEKAKEALEQYKSEVGE